MLVDVLRFEDDVVDGTAMAEIEVEEVIGEVVEEDKVELIVVDRVVEVDNEVVEEI